MSPLVVDHAVITGRLKNVQKAPFVQAVTDAQARTMSGARRIAPAHETSENLVVYLSGSTEAVVEYSFISEENVSASATFVIEQPQQNQALLDQAFARFVGYALEPEQPTDEDVNPCPVYTFPSR
jgi:hypothetical protein